METVPDSSSSVPHPGCDRRLVATRNGPKAGETTISSSNSQEEKRRVSGIEAPTVANAIEGTETIGTEAIAEVEQRVDEDLQATITGMIEVNNVGNSKIEEEEVGTAVQNVDEMTLKDLPSGPAQVEDDTEEERLGAR